jgi:hypothetical protein
LAGDWAHARTVAAQDVSPDQLDARVQQWMQMASPTHASDQVAMLTGVTPVADPGEPVRLALKNAENPLERYAQAASQKIQQTATVMLPDPDPLEAAPSAATPSAPQPQTAAAPEPHWLPEAAPEPMAQAAPEVIPEPVVASAAKSLVKPAVAPVAALPTKFEEASKPSYIAITDEVRKAAQRARSGKSTAVVQIGSYSSPQRVQAAWNDLSRRYPGLNRYRPVSARFVSSKGTFYRLAIKGFADSGDAQDMCSSLRGKGKTCFVRRVAGDSPVQMASR